MGAQDRHVVAVIGDGGYQMTIQELGTIFQTVGDYQPIYNNEEVCKYVTKYIGKDVDYDIVFKS